MKVHVRVMIVIVGGRITAARPAFPVAMSLGNLQLWAVLSFNPAPVCAHLRVVGVTTSQGSPCHL